MGEKIRQSQMFVGHCCKLQDIVWSKACCAIFNFCQLLTFAKGPPEQQPSLRPQLTGVSPIGDPFTRV